MPINSDPVLTFLLNATWQITLVVAVTAFISRLLHNSPAKYRHLLWVVALLASAFLPTYSALKPTVTASIAADVPMPEAEVQASAPPAARNSSTRITTQRVVRVSTATEPVLTIGYGLLLFLCLLRLARAWRTTCDIRSNTDAATPPTPLAHVWTVCTTALGVSRVQLLRSTVVPSPVALGVLRPAVILPDRLWEEANEKLLTAAVGHELAHVARRDFLLNLVQELLLLPVAFHPAAWYIRRQIQRTREMACDETVTTLLQEPRTYAQSIFMIASTLLQRPTAGYSLGMFEGGGLEDRIRRVLQRSPQKGRQSRVFLGLAISSMAVTAVLIGTFAVTARGQSAFNTQVKQGVESYNAGDFHSASAHFSEAIGMEPTNIEAKLYLANSLMAEFYKQSQPDARLRASAMQQYTDVLARDPRNKQAIAGMATLTLQAKQTGEAQEWATRLADVDPNDKTAWYTLGVLAWMDVFPEYQRARQSAGGPPEQYAIPDIALRTTFREQYAERVKQGMQNLQKAVALDPNYDAAMAYMNLLLRISAAMADTAAEANALLGEADTWIRRALETKQRNAKLAPPTTGPAQHSAALKAPPPPPPPPAPDRARQIASSEPRPNAEPNQQPLVAVYWQVLGSNDMPAIDLYRQLRQKGFEAVLHAGSDQLTRVLAGPYFDAASADKAKPGLQTAGFQVIQKWE